MAVPRLTGGLTPANGADPRTFPTIFNLLADQVDTIEATGGGVSTSDPRLSDARVPLPHKDAHSSGGTDRIYPEDIGAVASLLIRNMVPLTQAQYDALSPKDSTTIYLIVP